MAGNTLQQYRAGNWHDVKVNYQVQGNRMMVTIPGSHLANLKIPLNLEFKWSDNMQEDGTPLDWYVNGDVAPGGGFNFIVNQQINNVPQAPHFYKYCGALPLVL